MGVAIRHVDFDKALEEMDGQVIWINDLDPIKDGELRQRLTVTMYNGSTFSLIPSCSCGETTIETHPNKRIGDRCDYCLTEINIHTSRKLESNVWIRAPEGIPSLINPRFLWILAETFKVGNSSSNSIIYWLLDPYYRDFTNKLQIQFMEDRGIRRGMVYFLEHFDEIMELLKDPLFVKQSDKSSQIQHLYKEDRAVLFPKHLPLVHKSFNVVEKLALGTFVERKTLNPYVDAINTLMSLKVGSTPITLRKKESIVARTLILLSKYYVDYIKENHNRKAGDYRRLVYGSRLPWTARMVITSITDEHDYDDVCFPWSAAVPLFEIHLTNLLLKEGYTPNQIKEKIHHAVNNYDPDIDRLFEKLIDESPHRSSVTGKKGLLFIVNRNPSLKMGSLQALVATKIKKDVTDNTLSLSVLVLKSFGGDFDGEISYTHRLHYMLEYSVKPS